MCDFAGRCDTGTITITIDHPSDAGDDVAKVNPGGFVIIDTYLNDSDPDGDVDSRPRPVVLRRRVRPRLRRAPGGGSGAGGGPPLLPRERLHRGRHRDLLLCDQDFNASEAAITVTVAEPDAHAPVAVDDVLLGPGGPPASSTSWRTTPTPTTTSTGRPSRSPCPRRAAPRSVDPAYGTSPIPRQRRPGADTFAYQVCDAFELCDEGSVTVARVEANAPVAVDDAVADPDRSPIAIDVLDNDADADDDLDPSSVRIVSGPHGGSVGSCPQARSATRSVGIPVFRTPSPTGSAT